jgi:hypothetical protein
MDSDEDGNNSGMMPGPIVADNDGDDDRNENDVDMIQTTTNMCEDGNKNKDKTRNETLPAVARTMVTTITTKVVPAKWFTIVKTSVVCSIIVICIFIVIVLTAMGVWVYNHISKKRIHLVSFK